MVVAVVKKEYMKYLYPVLLIIIVLSCSGSKQVITDSSKEVSKTVEAKDSVLEESKILICKPEIIEEGNSTTPKIVKVSETKNTLNHSAFTDLLQKHVSKKGNVSYKKFQTDRDKLLNYIIYLGSNVPTNSWAKEEQLAYWINAYNAMTIDLILRNYPIKSIRDIYKPWDQRYWKLGEKWYNLDEIEHRILRKMNEPRIHFAIVCASFSCPKLQNEAFNAENLEAQLTKTTKDFLSDSNRNTISENNLELSKIFQWFSKDFKQEGSLIDFLNKYSEITISDKAEKSYKEYNWDLNE